jgi:hypothetical protein
MITTEGGIAIRAINNSGAASVKGKLVKNSTTLANAVELTDTTAPGLYAPVGVFLESGVPNGKPCWIVVSGIAYAYIVEGQAIDLGAGLRTSAGTAGTAHQFVPSPTDDEHWREIGHTLEAKTDVDTNRLVKAILHFN